MQLLLKFLIFLTAFYIQASYSSSVIDFVKNVNVSKLSIFKVSFTIVPETGSFLYTICDRLELSKQTNVTCNVSMVWGFSSSQIREKTCNLSYLFISDENELEEKLIKAVSVNQVLFIKYSFNDRTEHGHVNIHIIDINNCHIREINLPIETLGHIYPKKNAIEYIHKGHKSSACTASLCLTRFDYDGNKLDGPNKYIDYITYNNLPNWNSYSTGSAGQESYFKMFVNDKYILYRIEPDGNKIKIAEDSRTIAPTVVNNVLAACWTVNPNYINCTRHDLKSGARLDVQLVVDNNSTWWREKYHAVAAGLRDGGLMVVLSKSDEQKIEEIRRGKKSIHNFTAMEIPANGQIMSLKKFDLEIQLNCDKSWYFMDPERNSIPTISVVESNDLFCFQFMCYTSELFDELDSIKIASKCVPKNYFV